MQDNLARLVAKKFVAHAPVNREEFLNKKKSREQNEQQLWLNEIAGVAIERLGRTGEVEVTSTIY